MSERTAPPWLFPMVCHGHAMCVVYYTAVSLHMWPPTLALRHHSLGELEVSGGLYSATAPPCLQAPYLRSVTVNLAPSRDLALRAIRLLGDLLVSDMNSQSDLASQIARIEDAVKLHAAALHIALNAPNGFSSAGFRG